MALEMSEMTHVASPRESPHGFGRLQGAPAEDPDSPGFSGQGLNLLSREADASHRLLNLTPTPVWAPPPRPGHRPPVDDPDFGDGQDFSGWVPGYSLSPAVEVWAARVRDADPERSAKVVGVIGATSAGKSWLVGKLLDDTSSKPSRLEEQFDGVTLQSMTSDINVYTDVGNEVYYLDFEGTYGTQPLQWNASGNEMVMERCPDAKAWEIKRRDMLKECFQPSLAYLTCNVVVFVTREKLVCSRSLEECEHFARAANRRVGSALPPALVLVQNCCRPSEGLFNPEQCTAAFIHTHFGQGNRGLHWRKYFRTIDCFCIPDEFLVDKRTRFDGEEVCNQVLDALRKTLRKRVEEDIMCRRDRQIHLSQLQWFSVVSALCRIVNDQESVMMSSLYMHAGANSGGLGELRSVLMIIMCGPGEPSAEAVQEAVAVSLSIIARYAVRLGCPREELHELLMYLRSLYPCGARAAGDVECFDRSRREVVCGQMRLAHAGIHRSNILVRTVDADWLQGIGEWLRGGVTHAWSGEFVCHPDFQEFDDQRRLERDLDEQIEAYKLQKCLEGLAEEVGSPWVVKAHSSLRGHASKVQRDPSRLCVICMEKGASPGFFTRMWLPPEGTHLPVCGHCHGILEKLGMCRPESAGEEMVPDQFCEVCVSRDSWAGIRRFKASRVADHQLLPCHCSVCSTCAEGTIGRSHLAVCPQCSQPVRWMVDERALVATSWPAAARRKKRRPRASCAIGECTMRR